MNIIVTEKEIQDYHQSRDIGFLLLLVLFGAFMAFYLIGQGIFTHMDLILSLISTNGNSVSITEEIKGLGTPGEIKAIAIGIYVIISLFLTLKASKAIARIKLASKKKLDLSPEEREETKEKILNSRREDQRRKREEYLEKKYGKKDSGGGLLFGLILGGIFFSD